MRYAIIENGVVINVAEADEPIAPNWIGSATAGPGWAYDDGSGEFTPPPETSTGPRRLTEYAFRRRFTPAEKSAIYTAAESSVDVRIFLDDLRAADYIDLDFPETVAGVEALEAYGLIAAGRSAEILA